MKYAIMTTHIVFLVPVVPAECDDGIVNEEAEGQHPAETGERRHEQGDELGRRRVAEVGVDPPIDGPEGDHE